jgi:beta-glucanase (GH16 family)
MKNTLRNSGVITILVIFGFLITAADNSNDKDKNLIFSDEFEGTSLNREKWDFCPEWDRQGRSTWKDDMVSVSGGYLHLKFKKDPQLGASKSSNSAIANNWIRAGAVRTRKKNHSSMIFENSFGYYEARIQFPVVSGTWGAFWLMSPTVEQVGNGGRDGTEIDIIETIRNQNGAYNAALHWDGYGAHHKDITSTKRPVNIYDGEFHIFALDWSPSEYVFYVDGNEFWRVDGGDQFKNVGINQNPNYIKLSTESAPWAGTIPRDFTEAEMLVDYVRVYQQKP